MATMRRSVVRLPDGAILLRMTPNERAILRALVDDLRTIVGDETPTPGLWEADDPPPLPSPTRMPTGRRGRHRATGPRRTR